MILTESLKNYTDFLYISNKFSKNISNKFSKNISNKFSKNISNKFSKNERRACNHRVWLLE